MKKLMLTSLVIVMITVLVAGCGNNTSAPTPSTTTGTETSPAPANPGTSATPDGSASQSVKVPRGTLPLAADSATRIADAYALVDELAEMASNYDRNAAKYNYTLNCLDPAGSAPAILLGAWVDAVLIATDGDVNIELGLSNAFSSGGATEALNDMRIGLIDFVMTLQNYTISYWPLSLVIHNPALGGNNAAVHASVMWDLYKSMPAVQNEYVEHGVPMFVWANDTTPLSYKATSPITSISDIKGNIRAGAGPMQLFVTEVGASVFSSPIGDVYANIQNGVIDYLITSWHGIDAYKLYDPGVLNYYFDIKIGAHAHVLLANHDTWAEIERNGYADAIMSVSGDYLLNFVSVWEGHENRCREIAIANGGIIHVPTGQLETDIKNAYANVAEQWIEETGGEARAVYNKAAELTEYYNSIYH